jgi:type IV secretion system protein VirB11
LHRQDDIGLTRAETLAYAASVIDIVVQLDRIDGKRGVAMIAESASFGFGGAAPG